MAQVTRSLFLNLTPPSHSLPILHYPPFPESVNSSRQEQQPLTVSSSLSLTLPFLGVAATSILFADHARVHHEDRQLLRHLDQEAADAKRAEIRAQRGVLAELNYQIRENRNLVVGVAWLSCLGGSLAYTFSRKGLTTTQRVVSARKFFRPAVVPVAVL